MANRNRLLTLLEILRRDSDEKSTLSTAQVREALKKEGCPVSPPTLREDIAALQASGYEIAVNERNGAATTYAFVGHEWKEPELQLLVDAVSAAQFIPLDRSSELIHKLALLTGPSRRERLTPQILVSERIKAKNGDMILSVETIRKAIDKRRKISFRYLEYTPEMKQVPRHRGTPEETYTVSPYATVWNDDRYYLVGWSDKRKDITVFRIDRMEAPTLQPYWRKEPPKDFDVRDYTNKVFRMYGGKEEQVTLRCRMEILDQVIDRFGEGIQLKEVTKHFFSITVPVSLSTTFYAWVFMFVGKMVITKPAYVRDVYAEYLNEALDDVLA